MILGEFVLAVCFLHGFQGALIQFDALSELVLEELLSGFLGCHFGMQLFHHFRNFLLDCLGIHGYFLVISLPRTA